MFSPFRYESLARDVHAERRERRGSGHKIGHGNRNLEQYESDRLNWLCHPKVGKVGSAELALKDERRKMLHVTGIEWGPRVMY